MSYEIPGFTFGTLSAAVDLSEKQNRCVNGNSDGIDIADAGGAILAVLRNKPGLDQACQLTVNGVVPIVCDDDVTKFNGVEVGASGGIIDDDGGYIIGVALEDGVVDQLVAVLLIDAGTGATFATV